MSLRSSLAPPHAYYQGVRYEHKHGPERSDDVMQYVLSPVPFDLAPLEHDHVPDPLPSLAANRAADSATTIGVRIIVIATLERFTHETLPVRKIAAGPG